MFLGKSSNIKLFIKSRMQENKMGDTDFVSEIEHVEKYPDFEKFAELQHGLYRF